MLMAGGLL